MSQSNFRIDEGDGKYLNAFTRTIGGTAVAEQVVNKGQPYLATHIYWTTLTFGEDTGEMVKMQVLGDGLRYTRLLAVSFEPDRDLSGNINWDPGSEVPADTWVKWGIRRVASPYANGWSTTINEGIRVRESAPDQSDDYGGQVNTERTVSLNDYHILDGGTAGDLLHTGYLESVARGFSYEPSSSPGAKPIIFGPSVDDGILITNEGESQWGYFGGDLTVAIATVSYR